MAKKKDVKKLFTPEGFEEMGFTHLLFNLFAQGCSYIRFEYSGSGDSGCIDSTTAFAIDDVEEIDKDLYAKVTAVPLEIETDLVDYLNTVINDKILENADDWWNNDGGGGTLWVDCRDASYNGNHYVNIITTEESKLTGKLGDGANQKED